MTRAERRRLQRDIKKLDKNSFEYKQGFKAGKRQERATWVMAIDRTRGVGEKIESRIMEEVTKLYEGG